MAGSLFARLPFLSAAALIGVALADPAVETVANSGLLGAAFADNNNLGILPTLLVGLFVVIAMLARRFYVLLRRLGRPVRSANELVETARLFTTRPAYADYPYVFAMQLVALFILESGEQLAVGGKVRGGTAWLGGPVIFSLTLHALIGFGCMLALGALMRAIVRAFASIVLTAVRCVWLARRDVAAGVIAVHRRGAPFQRPQNPHVRHIGGRAPPRLLTLV